MTATKQSAAEKKLQAEQEAEQKARDDHEAALAEALSGEVAARAAVEEVRDEMRHVTFVDGEDPSQYVDNPTAATPAHLIDPALYPGLREEVDTHGFRPEVYSGQADHIVRHGNEHAEHPKKDEATKRSHDGPQMVSIDGA